MTDLRVTSIHGNKFMSRGTTPHNQPPRATSADPNALALAPSDTVSNNSRDNKNNNMGPTKVSTLGPATSAPKPTVTTTTSTAKVKTKTKTKTKRGRKQVVGGVGGVGGVEATRRRMEADTPMLRAQVLSTFVLRKKFTQYCERVVLGAATHPRFLFI